MAKKNKGVLSMNENYTFIEMADAGEISTTCFNCGTPIRYVVTLKDSKGALYLVGTECTKTLTEGSISNAYSMEEHIKVMKKIATARNLIENGSNVTVWYGKNKTYCFIVGSNKNGKAVKICLEKTYDPFIAMQNNTDGEIVILSKFIEEIIKSKFVHPDCETGDWCMNCVFKHYDKLKAIEPKK